MNLFFKVFVYIDTRYNMIYDKKLKKIKKDLQYDSCFENYAYNN